MQTVAVIDYGMGNLHSVAKALEHTRVPVRLQVTRDADQIYKADKIIFPGVGALRDCMNELRTLGLDEVLRQCATTKPFLGICLGMQALLDSSEENEGTEGLGIIPGRVVLFHPCAQAPKVPHMGWNKVHQTQTHKMWQNIPQDSRFYFVHSYYVSPAEQDIVAGKTEYGENFVSAITRDNLFAVQFHPEKSQHAGLTLLNNFLRWDGG